MNTNTATAPPLQTLLLLLAGTGRAEGLPVDVLGAREDAEQVVLLLADRAEARTAADWLARDQWQVQVHAGAATVTVTPRIPCGPAAATARDPRHDGAGRRTALCPCGWTSGPAWTHAELLAAVQTHVATRLAEG